MVARLLIRDDGLSDQLIQERKRKGIDLYDEVWEGMYVMPSMPNNAHQLLVGDLEVDHAGGPRLQMPSSRKGKGRKRIEEAGAALARLQNE